MISEASPYMTLIPKFANTILMSASSQYQNLCLFDDVKCLSADYFPNLDKRQSWIHPMANKSTNHFAKVLNLLNIEKSYNMPKQVEICTIDRILCDEAKKINLRDLPSFYYCSTSLVNQMKHALEKGDQSNILLDQAVNYFSDN